MQSFRCDCTMLQASRDRDGSGMAHSMARLGPCSDVEEGGATVCCGECATHPSLAFVQLHGDAGTWMHPVGEYNELEPDSRVDGSWFRLALSNDPPLSCQPPLPRSLSFFHSICLIHSVSPCSSLITSLSTRLTISSTAPAPSIRPQVT